MSDQPYGDVAGWVRPLVEARKATAEEATAGPWTAEPVVYGPPEDGWGEPRDWEIYADGMPVVSHQRYEGGGIHAEADARHIAANDPRDVIAQCEADLLTLDEHQAMNSGIRGQYYCIVCDPPDYMHGRHDHATWPCRTVRLLAWGYRFRDPAGYTEVAGGWAP